MISHKNPRPDLESGALAALVEGFQKKRLIGSVGQVIDAAVERMESVP